MKYKEIEHYIPKLVKASFVKGKLNQPNVRQIVDILKTLSKGNAIKGLTLYLKHLKNAMDQNRLYIESPVKLSPSQIDEIVKIVSSSHPVFETEVKIGPDLLAGFKIKIGDEIYEDSLVNKIAQIKEAIRG